MSAQNSDRTTLVDSDGTLHIGPGVGEVELDPGPGQVVVQAATGLVMVDIGDGEVIVNTVGRGRLTLNGQVVYSG